MVSLLPTIFQLLLTSALLQLSSANWNFAFNILYSIIDNIENTFLSFLHSNVQECCSGHWIYANISGLAETLRGKVYGQHLVHEIVLNAIQKHIQDPNPSKALAISFHGWTGSGKNYVARIIAEHLFNQGMKSKFVHLYVAPLYFPHKAKLDLYQTQLKEWIHGNISQCAQSLFIFDEVDMISSVLLKSIKPFLERKEDSGKDYGKAIFLFLSTSGGNDITYIAQDFWRWGRERESLTMNDLAHLQAFEEEELFWKSTYSGKCLIDYQIPLLPLERQHVLMCIRDYLKSKGKTSNDFLNKVADELIYYPPLTHLFSTTGCKRVYQKINFLMFDDDP